MNLLVDIVEQRPTIARWRQVVNLRMETVMLLQIPHPQEALGELALMIFVDLVSEPVHPMNVAH